MRRRFASRNGRSGVTEDELRQRARVWRDRAAAARDERDRTSSEQLAQEYEAMAERLAALKRRDPEL